MTVTFHPAKEQPVKAAVLTFVLGIGLQALWQFLTPAVAITLWVVLVVSLRDFFLETIYELDDEGLKVSGPLKPTKSYQWARFRAFIEDRNGLFLTPYLAKRATESQRGVFLPMNLEQRREAAAFCAERELARRDK